MKTLWFTNTPSKYDQGKHSYHGGGWIESLEELVSEHKDIELAISFFHKDGFQKERIGNTTYYPILRKSAKKTPLKHIINNWTGKIENSNYILQMKKIIEDFKPDLIHVFGTEGIFTSIQSETTIPVVIHLQGLINPIVNAYFPPSQSKLNFLFNFSYFKNNLLGKSHFFSMKRLRKQAILEENSLKLAMYVMGRTNWDKSIVRLYAPNAHYFHIDEVLRAPFYFESNTVNLESDSIYLVSTLSSTIYKGIDVVLKAAKLLHEKTNIKFKWQLIGIDKDDKIFKHFEKSIGVQHKHINIECLGRKSPKELILIVKKSHLFIHPSYIDNSPNSVCEAQMLGIPVVACNVGGITSLIEHKETGMLFPSNGIYELTAIVQDYVNNPKKYLNIAEKAREVAMIRHNKKTILGDVISCYSKIVKK
ncbi:glycosyltransferase family 4 protein [Flavobacterium luteum]|uniref:Glycosyltransferase family 4 protein n=1 Tax=Flavobacterium luteum TaxID=2026654 RepID=A0A7J5ADY5_9FLAO|nr:glycosyltransferase family 4 protein [Flavobacterium luteum]KAB1155784.1 glycosyltransferase family 4 protein [Flavobacterium luteum]